jgi:hypothetical protein
MLKAYELVLAGDTIAKTHTVVYNTIPVQQQQQQ